MENSSTVILMSRKSKESPEPQINEDLLQETQPSVGLEGPHYEDVTPVKPAKGMSRNGRHIELEILYKKLYTSEARKQSPHQLYNQSAKHKSMY